jgi:hypothetical protein
LALFTKDEYSLDVSVLGDGAVNVSPDPPFGYEDAVTLTSVPGAEMVLWSWQGAGATGEVVDSMTDPLVLSMTTDYEVVAQFVQESYALDITVSGSGQVSASSGGPFSYLDTVTLMAEPGEGEEFVGWSGTQSGGSSTLEITFEEDQVITAAFAPIMYDVNVTVQGQGSIILEPAPPYLAGTPITIFAVADEGWTFEHWQGDLGGVVNPQDVVVNADMSVTALFEDPAGNLEVWQSVGGSVSQDPPPPHELGNLVNLTAIPEPGYLFVGWSGDVSGTNPSVMITVEQDSFAGAYFRRERFQGVEVFVPFYLDNDGVSVPTNSGTRTLIAVNNVSALAAELSFFYLDPVGNDLTPTENVFELPGSRSLTWRPVGEEIQFEGRPGFLAPGALPGSAAGGARVRTSAGGLTGFTRDFVRGVNGAQSSYVLPGEAESYSLSAPFFLDNDGVVTDPDAGVRSFVGVQNTSDETATLTIYYRDAQGVDRTPGLNTVEVPPRGSVAWRPFAHEPSLEGAGADVPNMTGDEPAGNVLIESTQPIVGRLVSSVFGGQSQSAYLLPDAEGAESLVVPFMLDNDGIRTEVNKGVRTSIGVQNVTNREVTLTLTYTGPDGEDLTPAINNYVLGPFESVGWRPFGDEGAFEGAGTAVPNATGDLPAGGVRIAALGGRIVGRVVAQSQGFSGAASAYALPNSSDADTLVVPYFEDDETISGGEGFGTATFVGVMNVTPTPLTLTISYTSILGTDATPEDNEITLDAFQAISWRPVADDPGVEGPEARSVPNMVDFDAGSVRIYSPRGGIVGRLVQVNGPADGPQSAYLLPSEYPLGSKR